MSDFYHNIYYNFLAKQECVAVKSGKVFCRDSEHIDVLVEAIGMMDEVRKLILGYAVERE